MKPRIAVLGSGTASTALPTHLGERNDVDARLAPIRLSAFARSAYERLVVDVGYVDAGQNAAAVGCDAIFINSFADYGIEALRAALAIPVVGAGEASLLAAAKQAQRFAIVTVWPESMRFLYDERLRALELENRCAAIVHVSPENELTKLASADGVMARMQRRENSILAQLRLACQNAATEHAVGCIVLGCTCMAPIGPALAADCAVPVLESSRVGFAASVAAAAHTLTHGTRPVAPPDSTRRQIVDLVDAWSGATVTPRLLEPECPVCEMDTPRSLTS